MQAHLPLLAAELRAVNPEYVVTFGGLTLGLLTGKHLRLRDILATVKTRTYQPLRSVPLAGRQHNILPCYYLLGHGNPPKAQRILRYIREQF